MGLLGASFFLYWLEFCLFIYFVRKTHVFLFVHAHLDVCHYLLILYHFDKMNDIMMFFHSIESILLLL